MSCYLYTQLSQGSFRNDLPILNDDQYLLKCIANQDFIVTSRNSTLYKGCQSNIYFTSLSTSTSTLISKKIEVDSCVGKEYS